MALITEMARSGRNEMIEKIQLLQKEISLLEQKCAVSDTVAKKMGAHAESLSPESS